jgi:hypothetical protein
MNHKKIIEIRIGSEKPKTSFQTRINFLLLPHNNWYFFQGQDKKCPEKIFPEIFYQA